jgi:hypothetical protein
MTVVPRSAILHSSPLVCDGVVGRSGALSDGYDTVVLVRVVLADSVEVNASTILQGARQAICPIVKMVSPKSYNCLIGH